jgi:hypothetical protein
MSRYAAEIRYRTAYGVVLAMLRVGAFNPCEQSRPLSREACFYGGAGSEASKGTQDLFNLRVIKREGRFSIRCHTHDITGAETYNISCTREGSISSLQT